MDELPRDDNGKLYKRKLRDAELGRPRQGDLASTGRMEPCSSHRRR